MSDPHKIEPHRLAMVEAFSFLMKGDKAAAQKKLTKARKLTDKFYKNK